MVFPPFSKGGLGGFYFANQFKSMEIPLYPPLEKGDNTVVSARLLAFQILLNLEQKGSYPDRLIRGALDRHSRLDERDRALLTELVYGVVRWRGRLDWHIGQLSRTKPEKMEPAVLILLRLALYQVFFLSRVPAHAAVNESVEIAKSSQPPHIVKFVNGVLREAVRREESGGWAWPSPEENPADTLAVTTSHPVWLVRKLIEEFGIEEARMFCAANNTIAPTVLRMNTLKAASAVVTDWLKGINLVAAPSPCLPGSLRTGGVRQDLTRTPIFEQGLIQMQDEASQMVSLILDPKPGERVLDLCSGFGIKSTHIAILMENRGEVLAVDKSAWKLEELQRNARRQGVGIVKTLAEDVMDLDAQKTGLFDRVLLDAPCTGFGSVRRNPDIKWRRRPKDPYRMSQLQKELLDRASRFVKSGGVLVYATCTVFRRML